MESVVFIGDAGEQLRIDVLGYERAPVGEYFDDNWLSVEVAVKAGRFERSFRASFLTDEIEAFHKESTKLYDSLTRRAELKTLEEQLSLSLAGDGLGHIRLTGSAQDRMGLGNTLAFAFTFDQSQLRSTLQALARVLSAFPVRT